ncbi:MAG: hypothetical protein GY832_24355, partial [Chloroflexi bacterium]|nr:hypothetical protein [Chloroflexota bacterium]
MATKKRKLEEITGEYDFQVAVFGNGDSRTIIGKLEIQNQTEPTTIKGPAVEDSLILGLTYRFLGQWKNHHKYGRQFVFNSFVQARPYGERGTVRYLARAKGIGKTIAQRIWNIFGSESLDRLRDDPAAVVVGVPGLRLEVAKAAADAFSHQQGMEAVTIELTDLFDGRGFPRGLTAQVIDKWGNEAVDIIKEEPYKLLAFNGVGFLRADALYLALGLDPGAIERQARCAWHAINNDSNGHTWFPLPFPAQAIKANISGAEANVPGAIRDAFKRGLLVRRNVEGGTWVAEARRARNERTICECLRLAAKEMPDWPYMLKVRDHQQEELSKATQGIIGILAGSPGTGKTYCTAQMIGEIIKSVGDDRIAACAPTG